MSDEKSAIKTTLTILLKAGEIAVAESHDPMLWQQVLAAMSAGGDSERKVMETLDRGGQKKLEHVGQLPGIGSAANAAAFAKELGVATEKLTGAISPSEQEPFLHLDLHTWAAWAKNNPARGPNSISPTALAATLLTLWFRKANLGTATIEQAQAVLQTANVIGTNATRSIRNCQWLQLRGENQIVINPAKIAHAIELARAFCAGDKPTFPE
ncbi:MAG: hypothetical protein WAU78_00480 [Roseiarcus sp.]